MLKNFLIIVLLITNVVTLFYIYEHMDPESKMEVEKQVTRQQPPAFFYRIFLADGGVAEGDRFITKANSVELMERGRVRMSIGKTNIVRIEKVYFKTGKTEPADMNQNKAGKP